jgi:hypothetical protein
MRVHQFLIAALFTACVHVPKSEHVVIRYLEALRAFDAPEMEAMWSKDAVSARRDGSARAIDRAAMRDMHGFEKAVLTRWSFEILSATDRVVKVRLSEATDLYDALGVGKCQQIVVYSVVDGSIARMETTSLQYANGVLGPALEKGQLRYSKALGEHLRPWLSTWAHRRDRAGNRSGNSPITVAR